MSIRLATMTDVAGVAALAERGLVRLQLQLGVVNDRARRFYERHGFRRRAGYELLDKPLRERKS